MRGWKLAAMARLPSAEGPDVRSAANYQLATADKNRSESPPCGSLLCFSHPALLLPPMKFRLLLSVFLLAFVSAHGQALPFETVFKGRPRFDSLVNQIKSKAERLRALPLGERVAWFGRAFVGTP